MLCKKCGDVFPTNAIVDGKQKSLKNRSYCLTCSPWGKRQGYELRKKETVINKPLEKKCKICEREFPWNKNDVCSSCRSSYFRYCQRKKGIEFLGGKCEKCNENNHWLLTFHHIDPETKDFNLSSVWGANNWNKLQKEIEKCELLCVSCHRLEHINDDKINAIIEYYADVT